MAPMEILATSSWFSQRSGTEIMVISAVLATLIVLLLLRNHRVSRSRRRFPPGPWPWPLIGNFPSLLGGLPHVVLQKLANKYGGLMFVRLGAHPCIVVSTAEMARHIVKNHDAAFSSRPVDLFFEVFTGSKDMVMSPYGDYWRRLRRIFNNELFSPKRIASYETARTEEICSMMKVLRTQSERGEVIDLKNWLYYLTSNNMTRMICNKRYFETGPEKQQESKEFHRMLVDSKQHAGTFIISNFFPYLGLITRLQGWEKIIKEDKRIAWEICAKIMDFEERKKRRKLDPGHVDIQDGVPDFLDVLMSTTDGGEPLSDDVIMSMVVLDLMIAGTETTATSTEWAMTELVRHPDILSRALEEINSVVGSDRLVKESDIPNLPYLQAVVKESYRLHPSTPLSLPRKSNEKVELLRYTLPVDTRLILNIYAIHRDPNIYENPEEFNPERFFVDHPNISATSGKDHLELLPFGMGRRMCPGFALGDLLFHLMLAHLVQSFDWSLPDARDLRTLDVEEMFGIASGRANPLTLVAKPRSPAAFY